MPPEDVRDVAEQVKLSFPKATTRIRDAPLGSWTKEKHSHSPRKEFQIVNQLMTRKRQINFTGEQRNSKQSKMLFNFTYQIAPPFNCDIK